MLRGHRAGQKLTDVIMVVSFNMETNEINILQIPRILISVQNILPERSTRFTAIRIRAASKMWPGLSMTGSGLPIDHYVTINMDGFVNVVDAIGGVEVNVQESFTLEGVTIKPGLQTLDGIKAEKFVRERHSRGGDIGRINGQREFMAAIVKKLKGLSLGELTSLALPLWMKNVTTDMNVKTLLAFAEKAMKLDMDNMKFHMVAGEGATINGYSVWTVHKGAGSDP